MQIVQQTDNTIWLQAETDNEITDLGALHLMLSEYGASKMLDGAINFHPFQYSYERGALEVAQEGVTTAEIEVLQILPKVVHVVHVSEFINGVHCENNL
jgi:hypothetical protein